MPPFPDHLFTSTTEEQIKKLQDAIQEKTHRLGDVQQARQRAEEELMQCTRETERRVDLILDKTGIVDALKQLGHLLQQERHLSEQLNGQASADRNQERSESITNKARSLAAEILQVKELLAEAKARNMAAQALIQAPSGKSKRTQSK